MTLDHRVVSSSPRLGVEITLKKKNLKKKKKMDLNFDSVIYQPLAKLPVLSETQFPFCPVETVLPTFQSR